MNTRSPFDGYPLTEVRQDEKGRRSFVVRPRFLTPWRYKLAKGLGGIAAFGLFLICMHSAIYAVPPEGWRYLMAVILPLVLLPVFRAFFAVLLCKRPQIELTEDHVNVKGSTGLTQFDRVLAHKFSLIPHDAGQDEQRKQSLSASRAARKGKIIAPRPIYGNSFHLSYDYLGQRNDLMTIYSPRDAMQILTRLIACDEVLNTQVGMGDGFTLEPDEDWNPAPGDLA